MTPINTERRDKWATYELYKKRIAATSQTPAEYARRITALAKRLGV